MDSSSKSNLSLLSNIKTFEDFSYEITFRKFLNQIKVIIYLQNCDFNEELKKLKEACPLIENAIDASFIKSNNTNTTAVLLTFSLQEHRYTVYNPAQPSDTSVK